MPAKADKRKGGEAAPQPKKQKPATSTTELPKKEVSTVPYLCGFGNHHASEARPDALPKQQNNPQKCAGGLFAEQVSGTAFTVPRAHNQRTWLYKIQPTCKGQPLKPWNGNQLLVSNFADAVIDPNQSRWAPVPIPTGPTDFVQGLVTMAGAGSAESKSGLAIHVFVANKSMGKRVLCNSDGDMLIVPQLNALVVRTEMGVLEVPVGHICVVPRMLKFTVDLQNEGPARGWVCEVFNGHFTLPDLGPIGANGLANARDFEYPTAAFEDKEGDYELVQKFLGKLFHTKLTHSPFDVVAWHGNYLPYRYNLDAFVAINSVTVDHMDPSIFTVLTCPTNETGVACADFVIFPPRWAVQDKTFRPPYFHRNCMSEFMGNIRGQYDAKPGGAFCPGSSSLHSVGIGHGPSAAAYDVCSKNKLEPHYMESQMAFMFESTYVLRLTKFAVGKTGGREKDYHKCWDGLEREFQS